MKLRRLELHRMPGFERDGFVLDGFAAGLNVVVGPNASGKTTTCRAIRALLWPEELEGVRPVDLTSDWDLHDADGDAGASCVRIEREGQRRRCQREGRPVEPPPLPPSSLARCYTITVDDLFLGTRLDDPLAAQLAREMAGGYDLAALRKHDIFSPTARQARTLERERQRAQQQLHARIRDQQQLRGEEERLDRLHAQRDAAREARSELERLANARKLAELTAELTAVDARLATFPPRMDRLRGDELRRLEQLHADRDEQQRLAEDAQREAQRAADRKAAAALPESGVPQLTIEEQRAHLERLRDLEHQLRTAEQQRTDSQTREDEARQRLAAFGANEPAEPDEAPQPNEGAEPNEGAGPNESADGHRPIDAATLDRVAQWHRDTAVTLAGRRAVDAQLELLGPEAGDDVAAEHDAVVEGLHVLRNWFESSGAHDPGERWRTVLLWMLVGLLGLLAVALGVTVHPGWLGLLLPAALAAVVVEMTRRQSRTQSQALKRQYTRTGQPPPERWDADGVGRRIHALERRLAEINIARERQHQARSLRQRRDELGREQNEHSRRREQLRRELGIDVDATDLALVTLADRLKAYHDARADRLAHDARIESLQRDYADRLAAVNKLLGQFDLEPADGYDLAHRRSEDLARRAAEHEQARQSIHRAEEAHQRAEQAITRLDRQIDELITEAGLDTSETSDNSRSRQAADDPGARAGLSSSADRPHPAATASDLPREEVKPSGATGVSPVKSAGQGPPLNGGALQRRLERLPEYREASESRGRLVAQRDQLVAQLVGHEELAGLAIDEIDRRTDQCRQQADQYESLIEQIRDIETRVEQAKRQTAVEEALTDVARASDALRAHRDRMECSAAATWLLADVEAEHRSESQPPVLGRAAQWFAQFTRGRYRLVLGDNSGDGRAGAAFRAGHVESGRGLALEELSRGTQMQLLLAVRLAFAISAEQGEPLPILLDEVLSSTDPERFAAVADCVMALVGDGRQVFYFTCQPGDVAAWQSIATERGESCRTIDLAAERRMAYEPGSLLTIASDAVPTVPPPEGRSIDAYAALLEPPPLRPTMGAAPVHLAHLVEDSDALYRLLSAGIATYGQLAGLHAARADAGLIDADRFTRVRAKARMIDAFADAWQVGRGRPLSREVLIDAGVSENFIDGISALADELDRDARRLIEAIERPSNERDERAKGFRTSILRRVVDHLTDHGYLDPREPLDDEAIRREVLAAVSDDLRAGHVRPEEVDAIFRQLWQRATGQEQEYPAPRQTE